MEGLKKIPFKNYIILSFVFIGSVILIIYFYMWYGAYEKGKYNSSVVTEYLDIIHYNELEDYLMENREAIIYFSVFDDKEVYDFEKRFKRFINNNSLSNILYLNVTEELENNRLHEEINNKYCSDIPCIVIFENSNVESIFNIKKYNYDMSLLKKFLINQGVIDD